MYTSWRRQVALDTYKEEQPMTVKQLWIEACKFDGIDPESKFVVFTDSNPWVAKYNRAVALVQKYNNWFALRGRI